MAGTTAKRPARRRVTLARDIPELGRRAGDRLLAEWREDWGLFAAPDPRGEPVGFLPGDLVDEGENT